jgi:hypothetical protein
MTDKQIKLDGRVISIEEAIKAGLISENDIKKVQIIIDGVDVSGCPYYCGHDICKNTCHYFSTPCEWVDVQNCTYKQFIQAEQTVWECHKYQAELEDKLTAKEQECEAYKMEAEEGKEINAELKAENERLEDLYDRVLQTLKDIEIITQQGIDFFNETERHADWEKVAIFMKQQLSFILGEIEEG